jgi:hypothetical protein
MPQYTVNSIIAITYSGYYIFADSSCCPKQTFYYSIQWRSQGLISFFLRGGGGGGYCDCSASDKGGRNIEGFGGMLLREYFEFVVSLER